MFYITGDVHADMQDFNSRPFGKLKRDDCVIVCGDFGILWDDSPAERKNIKRLGGKKHATLFVDGAHENFSLLSRYPVTQWNGGKVQVISGNLMHLCRGQVYTIGERRIFTFGGGESADKEMRVENQGWWAQELPSEEEMREGLENLEAVDWKVDYILTHIPPVGFKKLIEAEVTELNVLNVYLEKIRAKCGYSHWIFAACHRNKRLSPSIDAVYDNVIRLY